MRWLHAIFVANSGRRLRDNCRISTVLAKTLYGGRYELLELLGVGESGSVYRVRDVELDGLLAMKVLRKELVGDRETIALFKNEVRLARRVTSHSVARVYDIGEHDGE